MVSRTAGNNGATEFRDSGTGRGTGVSVCGTLPDGVAVTIFELDALGVGDTAALVFEDEPCGGSGTGVWASVTTGSPGVVRTSENKGSGDGTLLWLTNGC